MCFLRNGSPYSFGTCTFAIYIPENLKVHCIWPSKYKGKWCFSPKCVFSETDHHTALKLVPLQLTFLWTSGCTEFDPLNTKESDVLAQNLFFEKWVIIQPWNLYHCDWHARKPQGALSLARLNTKESDVLAQNVFSQKQIMHTALKLVPLQLTFLWTSGCTEFDPLNTKESDVLAQNLFFFFSETGHHTALKLVPLQLTFLWTSGCTEFDPLNTKESNVLAQNLFFFFRNGSSYSLETCIIVIGMPENLRVHWVWPSKYKGKWCFSPKCVFSETDHHTALKLVPLQLTFLWTSGCTEFDPLNTKENDVLAQNLFFFFSETGHHTALKLVPLQLTFLWTSGCTEFDPLNTKESNVLAQNLFFFFRNGSSYSLETCIIVIDMPLNLRVHWVWPSKYKGKWCFSQNVLFCCFSIYSLMHLLTRPMGSGPLDLFLYSISGYHVPKEWYPGTPEMTFLFIRILTTTHLHYMPGCSVIISAISIILYN